MSSSLPPPSSPAKRGRRNNPVAVYGGGKVSPLPSPSQSPKRDTSARCGASPSLTDTPTTTPMYHPAPGTLDIGARANVFVSPETAMFIHCEGTSGHTAPSRDKSWLGLWKYMVSKHGGCVGAPSTPCVFVGCKNEATLGAHVRYSGSHPVFASWYIVPACATCNSQHGQAAAIVPGTVLLRVRKNRLLFWKRKLLFGRFGAETGTLQRSRKADESLNPKEIRQLRVWPAPRTLEKGWKRQL